MKWGHINVSEETELKMKCNSMLLTLVITKMILLRDISIMVQFYIYCGHFCIKKGLPPVILTMKTLKFEYSKFKNSS